MIERVSLAVMMVRNEVGVLLIYICMSLHQPHCSFSQKLAFAVNTDALVDNWLP